MADFRMNWADEDVQEVNGLNLTAWLKMDKNQEADRSVGFIPEETGFTEAGMRHRAGKWQDRGRLRSCRLHTGEKRPHN